MVHLMHRMNNPEWSMFDYYVQIQLADFSIVHFS